MVEARPLNPLEEKVRKAPKPKCFGQSLTKSEDRVTNLTPDQIDKYLCRICYEILDLDCVQSACNDDCEELFCAKCVKGWLDKNGGKCPNCRGAYKQKPKVNYKLKQVIEEIKFACLCCDQQFNYGDAAKHQQVCPGLNFVCPNEGCGHNAGMLSE